jgi:hypothetical protein
MLPIDWILQNCLRYSIQVELGVIWSTHYHCIAVGFHYELHNFCLKRINAIKLAYISYLLFITEVSFKLQFTRCLSDMSLEIIRATSFVQVSISMILGSSVIIHNIVFWKIWSLHTPRQMLRTFVLTLENERKNLYITEKFSQFHKEHCVSFGETNSLMLYVETFEDC